MNDDQALAAYLGAANEWESDRRAALLLSVRRAWQVAAVATTCCVMALTALMAITPLKTVAPYVIRVDNTSGVVDVVPLADRPTPPGEATTRYLLTTYVTARERYIAELAENDYSLVGAMQVPRLNERYARSWDRSNADSPLNLYRDGSSVTVRIHSITALHGTADGAGVSQVRFTTIRRGAGGAVVREERWIATIVHRYGEPSADPQQRQMNPLGLRVAEYQREPEVVMPDQGGTS
jgi:type IV secretion system protein VirB8